MVFGSDSFSFPEGDAVSVVGGSEVVLELVELEVVPEFPPDPHAASPTAKSNAKRLLVTHVILKCPTGSSVRSFPSWISRSHPAY
jgi:hypothetical protein